jgi:hypothetical protein
VTVDAALSVTIQPGLPLRDLVGLARYLDIRCYDTAATWELSRKAAIRGFDAECTPESIIAELRRLSVQELPRSVEVLLADWYASYSQVTVYQGFLVKVDPTKERLFEQNPQLRSRITEKIAPGIFLVDFIDEGDAKRALEKNLNQEIGRIHTPPPSPSPSRTGFFALEGGFPEMAAMPRTKAAPQTNPKEATALLDGFRAQLDTLNVTEEQYQELKARIDRRVILRNSQLATKNMRFIRSEATGLDFPGKLQLLEYAQTKGLPVELGVGEGPATAGGAPVERVLGTPVWLEKHASDVAVTLRLEPKQLFLRYSVGQLRYVRRVPQSIFAENG